MKKKYLLIILLLSVFTVNNLHSQCNTNTSICTGGVAGPFNFIPASGTVSSCLDFTNGIASPSYAYILLYITTTGPLDMLIQGNVASGFLDVAVFNVPNGVTPCTAINNVGNEIACNYASASSGCNQLGTSFACASNIPSPNVTAGDVLMIVVEDWSNVQTSFTLSLGAGGAQTGPPDPTITNPGTIDCINGIYNFTAASPGGTWSASCGTCINATTGAFDPATSGVGSFTITYDVGSSPCNAQDVINVNVVCVPCVMDSMPIVMINCYNTPFLQYDVSGTVSFTDPPTSGTLTITDCNSVSQVFNAPFGTSQAFTFTALNQTGTNCAFTAVFSADPTCTITTNFMSPPPITGFTLNQTFCVNNAFTVYGDISFSNPPATGTLIISYDNGTTIIDTIINAPFTSPENWSIVVPADGANYTITYYFSGFPSCAITITGTAPASCGCVAAIGTFTTSITPNNGQAPYVLCIGDQFTMTSNGDFVPPGIALAPDIQTFTGNPATSYSPDIGYLIYSCPPTIALVPSSTFPNDNINNDPCLISIVGFGNSFSDINTLGAPSFAGPWTNNTIYYVPITFYDTGVGYYSFTNTTLPCYEMGPPFAVQYLTPITFTSVPDCQDSSVTVTVSGGLPEFDGSLYTASNLLPATASFVNNTAIHGGTIVINGLQNGDMYSFDIVDANGCPATFTGGPFVGLPNANAGVDDTSCTLTYNLNATPSFGAGTWTGGGVFTNPNSATSSVTVPAAGIYTFTWTENNAGGCISFDDVTVTFNILSIPNTPTDPLCNGGNDGQIIVAPGGGTSPYTYQWDAAAGNQVTPLAINLGAGTYTVTITDNFGCFLDSTFTLTQPTPFTYTTSSIPANCGNPDGSITVVGFAGGTAGYTYDWGAGPVASNTLTNLTANIYTVIVADANGCDTTFTITVGNTVAFTASIAPFTNVSCNGFFDGSATASPSPPGYNYLWDDPAAQTTATATGLGAGTYIVTITDQATGCFDTASITIVEPSLVTVNANPISICLGQSANLTATGANGNGAPYTYNWDAGVFIGSPYVVSPVISTTYAVFAIDAIGCASAPINVTVTVSDPLIVVVGIDITICLGDPAVTISATGSFGNGNTASYIYTWDDGINVIGTGATQSVSPTVTTTYNVTLNDGCTSPSATAQITVIVNPLPPVAFDVDIFNLCLLPTLPFQFSTDTTGGLFTSILWNFGDGNSSTLDTVLHTYAAAGSYDVTLTVTDTNGCVSPLTKPNYVTVYPNPIADFTMSPSPTSMFDPTINFFDQSYTNIVGWSWDIGGLDSSNMPDPIYTFPGDTGNYVITLTVTDANGCTATISDIAIVLGEYGIYVPNAFTPDGDGLNDGFFPNGFGITQEDYTFFIFDRWGEIIYESHKIFEAWDGTYKGKLVQNGVYVWKLLFQDINGEDHTKIGHVTIVK